MEVIFAAVSSNDMMYIDWAVRDKGLWDGDVEKICFVWVGLVGGFCPKKPQISANRETRIAALFTRILSAYRGCGRAAVWGGLFLSLCCV